MDHYFDASKLFSTQETVAVVTGGGTGIGLMIAKALENNGAKVYITGRRKEILEKAAKANAKYGKLIPIVADVTSKDSLAALAKQIEQETGYVNLVVCNSGIMGPIHAALPIGAIPLGGTPGQMTELDDVHELLWNDTYDDWAKTFETNLTGAWFTSIAFLKLLDAGNKRVADKGVYAAKSQIVVISSTDGFLRHGLFSFAYSASKAALTHLAKSMATNFIRWGIRTNIIAPGLFPTSLTAGGVETMDENNLHSFPQEFKAVDIPLERGGLPEEMAGTILYLAGPAGAYLNGTVLLIDGGRVATYAATY